MRRLFSLKLFGIALVAALGAGTAFAQYGYPPPPSGWGYYHHDHDDDAWRYPSQDSYYSGPARETAERARSFGYHDGLADGQRDRVTGHSFRPTHSDRYEDAPDHGDHYGMSRGEFKSIYRNAYLRGYQRGYGAY
jgi:hypothetical protein